MQVAALTEGISEGAEKLAVNITVGTLHDVNLLHFFPIKFSVTNKKKTHKIMIDSLKDVGRSDWGLSTRCPRAELGQLLGVREVADIWFTFSCHPVLVLQSQSQG